MDTQLASNMDDLQKIFLSRMKDYDEKLKKAAAGGPTAHQDLASLSREYLDFKTFIWRAFSKMKSQLELLTVGHDRHEMMMRRKILLFHGIPENENERLQDKILKVITSQMKLPDVSSTSLQIYHRLGSSKSKCRPVLVRFADLEHRLLVWDNKTSLKGTGITISEFLTRPRHHAFTLARKHFGVKNCWSVEGKIVVLLPDKSRRKIETVAEMQRLIGQYPAAAEVEPASPSGIEDQAPKQAAKKTRRRN